MTAHSDIASPDPSSEIVRAFDEMDKDARKALMRARGVIFAEAKRLELGSLTEGLKWGQPSYVPKRPRTGTPIRLGLHGGRAAIFVHCQTRVVADARSLLLTSDGFIENRGVLWDGGQPEARHVIGAALTYHLR